MDNLNKMRALKDKMNELQNLVEDFLDSNQAKSNKIKNMQKMPREMLTHQVLNSFKF